MRGVDVSFKDGAQVSSVHLIASSSIASERYQLNTVSCSWYKPSKGGWLHYHSRKWAELAITKFGSAHKIRGRIVQAQLGEAPPHRSNRPIWSVVLGNMSVDTSKDDLTSSLRGLPPDNIIFGNPSHSMSEARVRALVEAHLAEYGPLESFESSQGLNASRMKALARFKNAADARTAASQLSGKLLTILGHHGSTKLFVNLTASVKFLVLGPLYDIVKADIQKAQSEFESVRINAYPPDREGKPVVIRLIGQDLQSVSKAKAVFERFTKGETILDDSGRPCWDDWFASDAGFIYIKALCQPARTFVYRDARKRQISVHGSSVAFERTRQAVLIKVEELSDMIHIVPLTGTLLSQAFHGAFRRMLDTLGRDIVKLDVTTQPPSIVVRGNASVLARAHELLLSPVDEGVSTNRSPSDSECPVCMSEPENALSLECGHSYCKDCFQGQCKAADSSSIPLKCFGDQGKCGQPITLLDLGGNLPSESFEALLSISFDGHLQKHPDEYQYCPSPDCPMIYTVTTDGTTKSCPACMTTICTTCQTVNHDGITCEESRYMVSDDYKAFQTWKMENDARDCPGCKTAIEKISGCNHMECGNCRAHICWFCMEVFRFSKECYDHMREKHRSIGL